MSQESVDMVGASFGVRPCVLEKGLYPGTAPDEEEVKESEKLRLEGNDLYNSGDVSGALKKYSEAIGWNPMNHLAFGNRSACWLRMERNEDAYDDASRCVAVSPKGYAKGWLRRGCAEWKLGRCADARRSFEIGLKVDPHDLRLGKELSKLKTRIETTPFGAVRSTLYRTMLLSPDIDVPKLYELIQQSMTVSILNEHEAEFNELLEYLCRTLECDLVALEFSREMRQNYDRSVFACGQLMTALPQLVTYLPNAARVIHALRHAMRCGWRMESGARSHGISKFAANTLTIIATAPQAKDSMRRLALRHLLYGLLDWVLDATPEANLIENQRTDNEHLRHMANTSSGQDEEKYEFVIHNNDFFDVDEVIQDHTMGRERLREIELHRFVCGCGALSPRLSAATWLERLFEKGSQRWIREECEAFVDAELLAMHLCIIVRDERGPPLGLPGLIRVFADRLMKSKFRINLYIKPEVRWDAMIRLRHDDNIEEQTSLSSSAQSGESDAALALRLQHSFDDEAVRKARRELSRLKPQRLGEWLAASLGYLLLFIDGDELFSAFACSALQRMASVEVEDEEESSLQRLTLGLWAGIPLLEKLSFIACKDSSAIQLLETLASKSIDARQAMLSLAFALSKGKKLHDKALDIMFEDDEKTLNSAEVADRNDEDIEGLYDTIGNIPHEKIFVKSESYEKNTDIAAVAEDKEEDVQGPQDESGNILREIQQQNIVPDHLIGHAPPTWSEYLHEVRGTLGIGSGSKSHNMILLGNFSTTASLLSVDGSITLSQKGQDMKFRAIPSTWNDLETDNLVCSAGLCVGSGVVGSDEWKASVIAGGCVLLLRSHIRASPLAPDWATAVSLSAEAGAIAVIVLNDLTDDGPQRPAFRMALFGAQPPRIPAFMVCGHVAKAMNSRLGWSVTLRTIRNSDQQREQEEGMSSVLATSPVWPLRGLSYDVAQAWALVEVVAAASPTQNFLESDMVALAAQMDAAEKRVWLVRRLQRKHRTLLRGNATVVDEDTSLVFVECDRESQEQLTDLRRQLRDGVGLGAPDVTGEFEVRFKNESAVGSAVLREWIDIVAHRGFVAGGGFLLRTGDEGRTFIPNFTACIVNPHWSFDFELLGRLLGLALWHQVTVDLPLHAYVCEALLNDADLDRMLSTKPNRLTVLTSIDPDLARSLSWILTCDDATALEKLEMPFTDALVCEEFDQEKKNEDSDDARETAKDTQQMVPIVVRPDKDLLPELNSESTLPLACKVKPLSAASCVELVPGGEHKFLCMENRNEFVDAMLDWRLRASLQKPLRAMARGLHFAIPSDVLSDAERMLTPADLVGLLSGLRDINVTDWKRHTRLSGGLRPDTKEVRMFWNIVEKWDRVDHSRLHALLQFATGSKRVPIGGFAHLTGLAGAKHNFTLSAGTHLASGSLPTAHACICTIDLPKFKDEKTAEIKLWLAVEAGIQHFDEHTAGLDDNDDIPPTDFGRFVR